MELSQKPDLLFKALQPSFQLLILFPELVEPGIVGWCLQAPSLEQARQYRPFQPVLNNSFTPGFITFPMAFLGKSSTTANLFGIL